MTCVSHQFTYTVNSTTASACVNKVSNWYITQVLLHNVLTRWRLSNTTNDINNCNICYILYTINITFSDHWSAEVYMTTSGRVFYPLLNKVYRAASLKAHDILRGYCPRDRPQWVSRKCSENYNALYCKEYSYNCWRVSTGIERGSIVLWFFLNIFTLSWGDGDESPL